MTKPLRQSDLDAYLDEALPPEEMARIESVLRKNPDQVDQLAEINARRDAGIHTLGEIWRRNRVSCPTREQLGSYLMGALPDDEAAHVKFHLEVVACRFCQANAADLQSAEDATPCEVQTPPPPILPIQCRLSKQEEIESSPTSQFL